MTEEFRYEDKKVGSNVYDNGSLQNLVNEEFKNIEKKNGRGYRDDQEIRNAGWNICSRLIREIKQDKTMVWGSRALQPLNDLSKTLKEEHDAMKGMKLFTNNTDKINQIANRIDNAENETLKRLQKNRTTQDSRDVVKKSEEKDKKNPMFTMELDNTNKETGNIVFTKASNPVKIHTALEGLFDNTDKVYQIDYSNCTNQKIKSKMTGLIGTQTCYLRYDEDQKTYTLRDKDGHGISNRVLIREGVKLIPDGVRKREAYQEQKKIEENWGKENDENIGTNVKNMLKDMPSAKKLTADEQKRLFQKTDERILELLKNAKSLGYELESECVTRLYTTKRGLMEVHFISGLSERDEIFWKDNSKIGSELYKFLDGEEGEYKTYLTNRIKQKWQELDGLTKTEKVNVSAKEGEDKIEWQEKQQMLYGIGLLEQMIDNYRESEGDSWLDKDDRNLVQIKQLIHNAKVSISESDNIGKAAIIKQLIDPIRKKWSSIKLISEYRSTQGGRVYENPAYKEQYNHLLKVFFGNKDDQIAAIRSLGGHNRLLDKTETSFLQQEIENSAFDDEEQKLEVKYTNVNSCIENIYNFNIDLDQEAGDFDESGNLSSSGREKIKQIDELYEAAKLDKEKFADYLLQIGLLPQIRTKEKKSVLKDVESLQKKLNNTQEQFNNFPTTKETLAQQQHYEKIKLEQKENKTEEDLQRLQALEYLEQNPDERNRINEITINMMKVEMKYGSIRQLLGSDLFKPLAELGGGAVGNNSKIYNDIIGVGFWNLSDENAKLAGEIITEIAITVAVAVVTGGIGGVAMAATLRGAAFATRGAKWVKLANKIYKVINISQKGYKGLSIGAKAVKLGYRSASLLVEGTVFNAASNMIHSAMNGTSLDNLNLNPIAKENVQTAAFLGALSISGRLTQGLMKAGGKTKLSINLMKGLEKAHLQAPAKFTTGLVTEMGSMLAAEQAVNFTFGHDVIDPETGEVRKERFHMPTQEELIQMTGMILAFKMVKPGLWHKYEQKLNEGTLEICRSVKKNEVLIRDPKTGKVESLHDLINRKTEINTELRNHIDSQYNNYESSVEQKQLREHNKWREKQSKYESDILQAQEKIGEMSEYLRSDAMKKLLEAKDIVELSQEEIMEIQKEIGLTGKDVDGIFGSNSLKKLNDYINEINGNSLGEKREKLGSIEEKLQFLKDNFYIDGLTPQEIEIFSKEQIAVLKQLKDLGMSVSLGKTSIELSKLTSEQLRILKELKGIGVDISYDIEELLKLTPEQIRILEILEGIGVNVSDKVIPYSKLTIDQVTNLKRINNELGIDINGWNINQLKNLELTPEQISILNELKGIGVDIGYDIEGLSKLTPEQINILNELKGIGVDISYNVEELLKLTPEEIKVFIHLKGKIVNFDSKLPDYIKLSAEEKSILNSLLDLGIKIENFTGYDIYTGDIILKKIGTKEIQHLQYLRDIGIDVSNFDFHQLVTICTDVNNNINSIKQLTKLGIKINAEIIKDLNSYTESEINKLTNTIENKLNEINKNILNKEKEIKKIEDKLLKNKNDPKLADNLKKTIENEKKKLEALKSIKESFYEIFGNTNMVQIEEMSKFASEFIPSRDEIKDYHKRKKEFLEKNQTLEDSDFNELFKAEGSKAKYGMSEINQKYLGYCYAYTGFELLKKSNFFETLVKTSIKKTNNGREVKLPLGDPNGHIVKVNCNGKKEIDSKYDFSEIDKNKPEYKRRGNISINSETSLGFKVLEIAFIKEYIINNSKYNGIEVFKKAREEYKNSGDITINENLLHEIEGGWTSDFFEHLLPKDIITTKKIEDIGTKKAISKFVNIGNTKVMLDIQVPKDTGPKNVECETIDGKKMKICTNHAYSIEKVYHDNTKNTDIIEFVNPWDTEIKYKITVEEACKIFNKRDITSINIGKIFQ